MTDLALVARLRQVMLTLAGLLGIGAIVELRLEGHTGGTVQLVPFVLSGLLIVAVAACGWWPSRRTIGLARVTAIIIVVGSGYGLVEHFRQNYLFEREIRPTEPALALILDALEGASPTLAPGLLAIGPILLLAASLEHPVLGRGRH